MRYELIVSSKNSEGVTAKLTLQCDAESLEEATDRLRGCLPGADWRQWVSTFGVIELRDREEEQRATAEWQR